MQKTILTLAALIALAGSASAGDRYAAPPPPSALGAPGARYYGPVNNYYAPVTIYAGGSYAYPSASYPSSYPAYPAGYATAPECDANCYGAGYDWSHGYSYSGGYAYGYPAYGYGYYGYPPSNEAVRMDPWAGYNWGPNNGYW